MSAVDWSHVFATRSERMRASEIRELLKLLDQPDIISFAGGIPDPSLFPVEAIRRAQDEILADRMLAGQALQYSVSEGYTGSGAGSSTSWGKPAFPARSTTC